MTKKKNKSVSNIEDKNLIKIEPWWTPPINTGPMFHIVMNRPISPYYDYIHAKTIENVELDNAYRIIKLETLIEQIVNQFIGKNGCPGMSNVEVVKALVDFKIAVDPLWITYHVGALEIVHNPDKRELEGCKLGVFINMPQHRIFVLNRESTEEQIEVEFMGLCWLAHYGREDIGRDVVVNKCAYKKYQTMFAGVYFMEMLKLHPVFIEKQWDKLIGMQQAQIVSHKFGNIIPPSPRELSNERIQDYAFWSQLFYKPQK
jgi:hypothetical protein